MMEKDEKAVTVEDNQNCASDYKNQLYTCVKCGETKEWDKFVKAKDRANGIRKYCLDCTFKKSFTKNKADRLEAAHGYLKCIDCGIEKELSEFYPDKHSKIGVRSRCKKCQIAANSTPELLAYKKRYNSERRKTDPRVVMYDAAKCRAKKLGLPFNITPEDIIIPLVCPVSGVVLETGVGKMTDNSPSLDKIKPELGYVKGNIAVVSWKINRIKSNANRDELSAIVKYIDIFSNINCKDKETDIRIFEPISNESNNPKVNRPIPFRNSADENRTITQKESL